MRIAGMVAAKLEHGETGRHFYRLHAWVIMPNNVHLLLTPQLPLPSITRWLKGSTALEANRIPGTTGQPFRRGESWDRWVRAAVEFGKTARYIERNPVCAGFVESPEHWRWSSAGRAGGSACLT